MDSAETATKSSNRLETVREALHLVEAFLRRYLPLTNAHTNDFLTHQLWELIPQKLAADLNVVTDWHEIPQKCINLRSAYQSDPTKRDDDRISLRKDFIPVVDANCFDDGVFDKSSRCAWHSKHESLDSFLAATMCCTLEALDILTAPVTTSASTKSTDGAPFISHAMGIKKSHEIQEMASFTAGMCQQYGITRLVDVGSGKGYLGTYLNLANGFEVIELDSVRSNIEGSISRRSRLEQRWEKLCSKAAHLEEPEVKKQKLSNDQRIGSVVSITTEVESPEHLDQLLSQHVPDVASKQCCALTGLHTCGHLAMCAIDTFIRGASCRSLINVGCCYHLFDEANYVDTYVKHQSKPGAPTFPMSKALRESNKPSPFALGRNARMIASQSIDRLADQEETLHDHMFFRVLLQQLLKDHLGYTSNDWIVGKLGKKKKATMDFVTYVRKALAKLKLSSLSEKLSDEDISKYQSQWSPVRERFHLFYILRCCLGAVVESCILLDRLCYLLEHACECGAVSEAHLFRIFDPVKSPRCYALFALKSGSQESC